MAEHEGSLSGGGEFNQPARGSYDQSTENNQDDASRGGGRGGSSDNENNQDVEELKKPANKIKFCNVRGRLELLTQNKVYEVSVAEIQRRINDPECLNSSLLSAILRKQVVESFKSILKLDESPINDRPLDKQSKLHQVSQKEFANFSLLTHGFGMPAILSSWDTLLECAKILQNALEHPKLFKTLIPLPLPQPLNEIIEKETLEEQQQHPSAPQYQPM
uniref:Transcription factor AP-2 C-terminal domain-containing protein n=1 Tax=Panagrolaimus davidi TaxID=227884 RepID=A0A914PNS8_9BILA